MEKVKEQQARERALKLEMERLKEIEKQENIARSVVDRICLWCMEQEKQEGRLWWSSCLSCALLVLLVVSGSKGSMSTSARKTWSGSD